MCTLGMRRVSFKIPLQDKLLRTMVSAQKKISDEKQILKD